MHQSVLETGKSINLTATGDVSTRESKLMGFYVNSTGGGTVVLKKGGSGGTALGGTITPDVGYHAYPAECVGGIHATISGTIDITVFYRESV